MVVPNMTFNSNMPNMKQSNKFTLYNYQEKSQIFYQNLNFGLWTQKFVGASGNLNAILLYVYLANKTFVNLSYLNNINKKNCNYNNKNNNSNCRSNTPKTNKTNNVELYPNKLLNLSGRSIKVGSISYIPYVVTNYVVSNLPLTLYLLLFVLYVCFKLFFFCGFVCYFLSHSLQDTSQYTRVVFVILGIP